MVQAGEQDQEGGGRTRLFNFKGIFEGTGRHTKSLSIDTATQLEPTEDGAASSRSQGSKPLNDLDKIPKPRTLTKEELAAKEAKEKILQGQCHYYHYYYLTIFNNHLIIHNQLSFHFKMSNITYQQILFITFIGFV